MIEYISVIHGITVKFTQYGKVIEANVPIVDNIAALAWVLLLFDRFKFRYVLVGEERSEEGFFEENYIELNINEKDFDKEGFIKAIENTKTVQ